MATCCTPTPPRDQRYVCVGGWVVRKVVALVAFALPFYALTLPFAAQASSALGHPWFAEESAFADPLPVTAALSENGDGDATTQIDQFKRLNRIIRRVRRADLCLVSSCERVFCFLFFVLIFLHRPSPSSRLLPQKPSLNLADVGEAPLAKRRKQAKSVSSQSSDDKADPATPSAPSSV